MRSARVRRPGCASISSQTWPDVLRIVLMVLNKLNVLFKPTMRCCIVCFALSKDAVSAHLPNQHDETHKTDTEKARSFAVFVIPDKQRQSATTRFFEHH